VASRFATTTLAAAYKLLYGWRVDDEPRRKIVLPAPEVVDRAVASADLAVIATPGAEAEVGVWERNFRERMVRMREAKGMTQTDLARALKTDFGLPFHQQTIQRIESGERPVRLNEANLIAQTLHADLFTMMSNVGSPEVVRLNLELAGARLAERGLEIAEYLCERMEVIDRLYQDVQDAWEAYEATQEELGEPVDKELSADVRRYESRYERARAGWSSIMNLGDF
jgi:transcriptional regulator with XRE-family HTH domain